MKGRRRPTAAVPGRPGRSAPGRSSRRRPSVGAVVAAVYLLALAVILLWPEHLDRHAGAVYRFFFRLFPGAGADSADVVINVLLFLPFGALLAPLSTRRPWAALAVAMGVPTLVELTQAVFLPGRTASVLDVIANGTGAIAGAVAVALWRRRSSARQRVSGG
ncbi:VanZ family protein [Microbacterium sp. PRF11]|uniref:VanZ family protein n=1 Tax=Microbacterium sp. PRF11 TaxID=2962593 RepID=UPI0028825327|nr:VanZ family protein [Microbacterium sp. PRF11]MDT0116021.1 VanZ family protein [Microbacterium sp. PRF11]